MRGASADSDLSVTATNHLVASELRVYLDSVRIRCPSCGKQDEVEIEFRWRPFCSRRCKMVDLGNWLDEVYKVSRPLGASDFEDDPMLLQRLVEGEDVLSS